MRKTYLGDGVYVELDGEGRILLTTSNGIRTTNSIYLAHDVLDNLDTWLEHLKNVLES